MGLDKFRQRDVNGDGMHGRISCRLEIDRGVKFAHEIS
jgi:hypothetical protein